MQHQKRKNHDEGNHDAWDLYMSSGRNDIMKTIPRIKPRIDGKAYLFWIVPETRGTIRGELFCNERAQADKIYGKAEYNDSTTFFLENRNLHDLPSQLKGSVCAIRSASSRNIDDFKLCFIHKADYELNCLQYLEWTGRAFMTNSEHETVAEFQTMNRKNLSTHEQLSKHFELRTQRMVEKEIIFLSKVAGWDFFSDSANPSATKEVGVCCKKKFIIDRHDGCFYANPCGPDKVSLPKLIGEKF